MRLTIKTADAGGATRNPNTSRVPTTRKLDTTETASSVKSAAWARSGRSPSVCALSRLTASARIAVPSDEPDRSDHKGDDAEADLVAAHAEYITEKKAGEVAGEGRLAAEDHDAECEHPDEEQADAGVVRKACGAVDQVDAADHHECADERAQCQVEAPDRGECDTGKHTVSERITEEGEAAHHNPCADEGRGRGSQQAADQRASRDLRLKGIEDDVGECGEHQSSASAIS